MGVDRMIDPGLVSGSEDVGVLARAAGVPLVYWLLGAWTPLASTGCARAQAGAPVTIHALPRARHDRVAARAAR